MVELMSFITTYKFASISIVLLNSVLCYFIYSKIYIFINRNMIEAYGGRKETKHKYDSYKKVAREYLDRTGQHLWQINLFSKLRNKNKVDAKQCGLDDDTGIWLLVFARYVLPLLFAVLAFVFNNGSLKIALLSIIAVISPVEYIIAWYKKTRADQFRSSAYKIYRYLHNQVTAGVTVIDSLKSVYKIVEDEKLQKQLILLSSTYGKTLDLQASLTEFQNNYIGREAKGLCIAISQGILTGDNKSILEKKEDEMFQQYFNYIEVQTESSKKVAGVSIVIFLLIITVMVSIPLVIETLDGLDQIFIG